MDGAIASAPAAPGEAERPNGTTSAQAPGDSPPATGSRAAGADKATADSAGKPAPLSATANVVVAPTEAAEPHTVPAGNLTAYATSTAEPAPEGTSAVRGAITDDAAPAADAAKAANRGGALRAQVVSRLLSQPTAGGDQHVTLRLEPAHLGKLEVDLQVQQGRLTVVFAAESADVERALQEGADELAEALLQRGGRWQEVEVRAQRESDDGRPRGQNQERQRRGASDTDRGREDRDRRERRRRGG
jgi:flagellar hook-length control protein FliK